MALSKFKLVNTKGLEGVHYKGDFIKLGDIDDELAEELINKTHVLERVGEVPSTKAPKALTTGTAA